MSSQSGKMWHSRCPTKNTLFNGREYAALFAGDVDARDREGAGAVPLEMVCFYLKSLWVE